MTAVSLEHVTKRFRRSRRHQRPLFRDILRLVRPDERDAITALDDIGLAIQPGERVGIVGANGAGKSTLLRIVAGIYQPTVGRRRVPGRVACYMAPRAGLAPALTVVDNLYLYGSILGLTKRETNDSLGRVLRFAELEDYRFARLEHLSYGMQHRLFLGMMLEVMREQAADLFLFDEWMSGVDARFQEKGERAVLSFRASNSTLLIASHDAALIGRLCERTIYLGGGRIAADGATPAVLAAYFSDLASDGAPPVPPIKAIPHEPFVQPPVLPGRQDGR